MECFCGFSAPDLPDFQGWCEKVREKARSLFPSDVRLVVSQSELRDNLEQTEAIVTESLTIGEKELTSAPRLNAVP